MVLSQPQTSSITSAAIPSVGNRRHRYTTQTARLLARKCLEHLYILLYALVLLMIIDVFLVVRRPSAALLQYRHNLFPKLCYWPILGMLLLLSTLAVFVYGAPS
jgi:hypothetical protein